MRFALLLAALTTAAGLGAAYASGAFGGDSQPRIVGAAPPPPDAAEVAAIRQLVLRTASDMGEQAPTEGFVVPTTRRLAELVDLDTDEPDTPVYFVVVHGLRRLRSSGREAAHRDHPHPDDRSRHGGVARPRPPRHDARPGCHGASGAAGPDGRQLATPGYA